MRGAAGARRVRHVTSPGAKGEVVARLPPSYTDHVIHDDPDAAERAKRRRNWPLRAYSLGDEPSDNLSATTTAEERLAMMWPLAVEAWALAGKPMPDYTRESMPVRVLHNPESHDESDG